MLLLFHCVPLVVCARVWICCVFGWVELDMWRWRVLFAFTTVCGALLISLSLCVYKYIKLRARCCCCIPFEHIRLLYIHSDTRTNERREWAHTRVACGMLYCWIGDQQQFAFADDRCFFFFYLVVLRRRFGRWTYNIHMRNACIGG